MKSILLASVIALAIAAPAVAQTTTTTSAAWTITLPANLKAVIVNDLTAAAADATAHNDTRHGACWTALASFAQGGFDNPLPNQPGVFLLVQKGFDFQGQAGTPLIPTALAQACGPVVLDLKVSFAQFLAKAGFAVSPIKLPIF